MDSFLECGSVDHRSLCKAMPGTGQWGWREMSSMFRGHLVVSNIKGKNERGLKEFKMENSGTLGTTKYLLAFPVLFLPGNITADQYKLTHGVGCLYQACGVSGCWWDLLWKLVGSEKMALQGEHWFTLVQKGEEGRGKGWICIDLPVSMEIAHQQPPFVLISCQMASLRFFLHLLPDGVFHVILSEEGGCWVGMTLFQYYTLQRQTEMCGFWSVDCF